MISRNFFLKLTLMKVVSLEIILQFRFSKEATKFDEISQLIWLLDFVKILCHSKETWTRFKDDFRRILAPFCQH